MSEMVKISRRQQAEQMRERIQSIVMEMSKTMTLDEMKIRDIASRAGISVGNFYQYFGSKEEALIYSYKVKDHVWQTLNLERFEDPLERLQAILVTHVFSMTENSLCFDTQLYIAQLKCYDDYFFTSDRYLHQFVTSTIEEAQRIGEMNDRYDAREMGQRLLGYTRGLVYNYCIHHTEEHDVFLPHALECLQDLLSLYVVDPEKLDLSFMLAKVK